MPGSPTPARQVGLGMLLVAAGALGLLAAFALTIEKFAALADPSHAGACGIGVLVSCGASLSSAQGAVFGFPNSLVGLVAWPVVITLGVAAWSGVRLPRWFWLGLNAGLAAAMVAVGWFAFESIVVLDALCPWCMLTWAVVIPLFWAVTWYDLRAGHLPAPNALRRFADASSRWFPLVATLACYGIVIVLAQVGMDAIPRLILDLRNLGG